VERLSKTAIIVLCLLLLTVGMDVGGCGMSPEGPVVRSSTTAAPTSVPGYMDTSVTTSPTPVSSGGAPSPRTTVNTGTTGPEGQLQSLTFVGPLSRDTWDALREIVMAAEDDGQKVLDNVAALAAGPPVAVGSHELDTWRGIGYTAGASSSQPIGVATDADGTQVIVYAFQISGDPDATTIVGFERTTGHVELVVGPLAIDDSTQNVTTVPSPSAP
jgi:hypothetical protein